MSEQSQMELSPRQKFVERAQVEMDAFERREGEFRKKARRQRAEELGMRAYVDLN